MRTFLHLVALVGGAAMVYRGLTTGLPTPPLSSHDWGTVGAFGFGVMLALVGARHVWQRLNGADTPLVGGAAVLVLALAVAATIGAVTWRGRGMSRACAAMIEHIEALVVARDPAAATRANFERARPKIARRCQEMSSADLRCAMAATTIEELQACP